MAKRKKKYVKRNRLWLNPISSYDTGALEWEVGGSYGSIHGDFAIWDCSKKIVLNFAADDLAEARKRAKKVDTLITELQKFKQALGEAWEFTNSQSMEDSSYGI